MRFPKVIRHKKVEATIYGRSKTYPFAKILVLTALGGIRVEEVLRLDWADIFGIPGHVELMGEGRIERGGTSALARLRPALCRLNLP